VLHLVDARLKKWAETVLKDFPNGTPVVRLDPPTKAQSGIVISLFLLEVVNDKALARSTRPFPQPALRYLVTASGSPEFAHQALGILLWNAYNIKQVWGSAEVQQLPGAAFVGEQLFQAPYHPKLELEPVPSRIWSAFSTPPQPSFMLRIPVPFEWLERPLPRVTGPAEMDIHPASGMVTLYGQIFQQVTVQTNNGAGAKTAVQQIPVSGALVELPNPYRQVYTDRQGRFALPGVNRNRQNNYQVNLRIGNGIFIPFVPLTDSGTPDKPVNIPINFLHGQLVDANNNPIIGAQVQLTLPDRIRAVYRDRAVHMLHIDPQTPDDQIPNLEQQINNLLPDYLQPYRLVMSDQDGIFIIPAVLADPPVRQLKINAKNAKGVLIEKTETFRSNGRPDNPAQIIIKLD